MVTGLAVRLGGLADEEEKKNNQSTHVWSRPQQMVPLHHMLKEKSRGGELGGTSTVPTQDPDLGY